MYKIFGCDVYLSGGPAKCKKGEDDFFIIASDEYRPDADRRYGLRWRIEQLFKELKSNGFDLEQTHLAKPERLSTLLILLVIAYAWILRVGQHLADCKPQLVKICKHGFPRNSITKLVFIEIRNAFWSQNKRSIKRALNFFVL